MTPTNPPRAPARICATDVFCICQALIAFGVLLGSLWMVGILL